MNEMLESAPARMPSTDFAALEICSGAGGQAAGLEAARFDLAAAIEIDPHACRTLRANRPQWRVLEIDVREIDGRDYRGVDLFAGGVPCPPFSIAGKQLGGRDNRDLFPEALRLIEETKPAAVLLENVPGFAMSRFKAYRNSLLGRLEKLGFWAEWRVLNACSFGVPQLRPRFVLVAIRSRYANAFSWPQQFPVCTTVGHELVDLMAVRGWEGADLWRTKACGIAPTVVGGSTKHGGPDLGPTRAKRQWRKLGVDGLGIADEAPPRDFPINDRPRLTVRMVARLQGFSDNWAFTGGKTAAYRQVGNAFPPPVAKAIGDSISDALAGRISRQTERQVPLFAAGD